MATAVLPEKATEKPGSEPPVSAFTGHRIGKMFATLGKRIVATVVIFCLLGMSLLPLAALLLLIPAFAPQESVLTDTVRSRSPVVQILRRIFAVLTSLGMLLAILAFSTELVTRLDWRSPYFGLLAGKMLGMDVVAKLPPAMSEGWPYMLLFVYLTDLVLLFFIGKIPLHYNYRNLIVRWRITVLTGLAFTVVIALLTVMLGFVNGLNELTTKSGIPGNVFVLSEGGTDEFFSNLGYGDVAKLELEKANLDKDGNPLAREIRVKTMPNPKGSGTVAMLSKETYFSINQPIPTKPGQPERRRFTSLRGVQDPLIAAKVHNITLQDGDWFPDSGGSVKLPDGGIATPVVVGEGAAAKYGEEQGKGPPLKAGDPFMLGDLQVIAVGIMKTDGSIFASEVWGQWAVMSKQFRKESYTTVVLRVDDDKLESAENMAAYLNRYFKTPAVNARSEPKYFEELGKSNQQLLYMVIVVAIIMALGGVFGVMNTMFAAISQRIRDIGVLRILGFKRWQILVSFMLESLAIAILGGLLGVLIGSLADGKQMTSTVSSGQGGKTVIMRIIVDSDVLICGILFTIVMGRLGGLVPSLSAMRLGILQSLK